MAILKNLSNLVKLLIKKKLGFTCVIKRMSVSDQYEALAAGKIDGLLGAWMPAQSSYYDKHKNSFEDLGPNLEGARLGLVVPDVSSTWLIAQDGQHTESYMKINSIAEIKDHYEEFGGKIIGIEEDSGMMRTMRENLIPAYGLEDFDLIPGSEVSMTAELANAIKKRRWLVVLGWSPHWKFGRWKLKFLDDPKKVWGDEAAEIRTLVRKGLKAELPEVFAFLDKFQWTPEQMEQLLIWNEMGGNPHDNAKRWIKYNRKVVDSWF